MRFTPTFYARWRAATGLVPALREGDATPPPERLLQAIWQHQRLRRDELRTLDGQPVAVLHPGFRNAEAGPDFHGAVAQFGAAPARAGDVEIDLRASGWRAHSHAANPAYASVILHVVWDADRPAADVPTVALRGLLDAPLAELNWWLGTEGALALPEALRGKCSAPLADLAAAEVADLLGQAARLRFESKAAACQARARQAGWEQALWEGVFRALGYKHNVWPMHRLAELRQRWHAPGLPPDALQARLLGLSGLLPSELTRVRGTADACVRGLWDRWWRERDGFSDCVVPRAAWRFSNLRPANHPQRRLALVAHWLGQGNLPDRLDRWLLGAEKPATATGDLLTLLQPGGDDFWRWHWTLRSARLARPQPLLGEPRVTDLAVNVILPWLWMRAVEGGQEPLKRRVEALYFGWPAAEDNARLKQARARLLGGAARRFPRGAAAQQGLLQILGDFCDNSNSVCDQCRFPQLVRDWRKTGAGGTEGGAALLARGSGAGC